MNKKMKKIKNLWSKEEIKKAREELEEATKIDFEKFRLAKIETIKKAHEIILD